MEVIPGLPGGIIGLSRKSGRLQDWLGRMSDSWQLVEVIPPILWWGWGCIPRTYSDGFCFKKWEVQWKDAPFRAWNPSVRSKKYPPGKLIWNHENGGGWFGWFSGFQRGDVQVPNMSFPETAGNEIGRWNVLLFLGRLPGVTLQPKVWNDHFWWG